MDQVTARQGEMMRRDAMLDFNLRGNVLLGLLAELGTGISRILLICTPDAW